MCLHSLQQEVVIFHNAICIAVCLYVLVVSTIVTLTPNKVIIGTIVVIIIQDAYSLPQLDKNQVPEILISFQ